MPATVEDYLNLLYLPADHRIAYGSSPEQFGDLYVPPWPGPHPLVIALHGGCWRAQYGLSPMSGLCARIAREGFAVWNLEYRRVGNGGGWPVTFHDVAAGADFVRTIAGLHALDLGRVTALGHSAGGHLALWLAARGQVPRESEIASQHPLAVHGIVSLAGIVDLVEAARLELCGTACTELLGGTPEQHADRYGAASPMALLPLGVRQRHIVGRLDDIVPVDFVERYVTQAAAADDVRLAVIEGAGHFEPAMPDSLAWEAVREALRDLR